MVTLQSLLRDKAFYRDVAQLVAHYVRDVGVGRSSRLIPTIRGVKTLIYSVLTLVALKMVGRNSERF